MKKKTNCNCSYCGKDIYKTPSQLRKYKNSYCDNKCASNSRRKLESRNCTICNTIVTRKPAEFKSENTFCSRECYHVHNRSGYRKIKREIYNCDYCSSEIERLPSTVANQTYIYCDRECKNRHHGLVFTGERHPSYNPNLTDEERVQNRKYNEYYKWRQAVYERDNFTCQCCGDDTGGNLVAHHILNYSEHEELRTELDNGITLCDIKCHKAFHDEYGYTKNNREQLNEFIHRRNLKGA